MASTLRGLMDAASALPAPERAELAQFLLDTLDEGDPTVARAEWLALAERRMADVKASRVAGIPVEEVRRTLLEPGT